MGKLQISDDLKGKLDRVLGIKQTDIDKSVCSGPAPVWNNEKKPIPMPPPPPPLIFDKKKMEPDDDFMTAVSSIKPNKKKKGRRKHRKKSLFVDSVIIGIGLTLGFKIGKILFY